jgi:hypothetical protein
MFFLVSARYCRLLHGVNRRRTGDAIAGEDRDSARRKEPMAAAWRSSKGTECRAWAAVPRLGLADVRSPSSPAPSRPAPAAMHRYRVVSRQGKKSQCRHDYLEADSGYLASFLQCRPAPSSSDRLRHAKHRWQPVGRTPQDRSLAPWPIRPTLDAGGNSGCNGPGTDPRLPRRGLSLYRLHPHHAQQSRRADANPTVNINMPPDQFCVSFSGTTTLASHIHAIVISWIGAADACGR